MQSAPRLGSSYASSSLMKNLHKKPAHTEHKQIEMMVCLTTQKVNSYKMNISSVNKKFEMSLTMLNEVDNFIKYFYNVLFSVPNPRYEELLKRYRHLEGVVMDDNDELPVHVILGASDYSRVKMETKPRIGQQLEPIAELTTSGWTVMSAGSESNLSNVYATRTSSADYQELCSLDVLGLEDRQEGGQLVIYEGFAEQLTGVRTVGTRQVCYGDLDIIPRQQMNMEV